MNLPAPATRLLSTPQELTDLCNHLRTARTFAFDTEFIGESTYQPILCLIQVATAERVDLIDPIAIGRAQMLPFWQLLADPAVEKICHAGDQDVEIVWLHSAFQTHNMFDTQIGAGMMGIAYPTALWRVVEHFTGTSLDKAHTYSAWDRRPLSPAQFQYAIDDVRYLPFIHARMAEELAALNRTGWMRTACEEMCLDSAKPVDARRIFAKLRGAAGLSPEQLSVLREIASLREQIAYEHDLPARAFLKDEVLFDIATRMPRNLDELARIRDLPAPELDSYGPTILAAIQTGRDVPPDERPTIQVHGEDSAEEKRLIETLWVATQAICLGQRVTPALVANQSEIANIARHMHNSLQKQKLLDMPPKHPLMQSWHRECLGEKLEAFMKGQLHIQLHLENETLQATFPQNP